MPAASKITEGCATGPVHALLSGMLQRSPKDAALLRLAAAGFAATAVVGYTPTHWRRAPEVCQRVRRGMRQHDPRARIRAATAVSMLGELAVEVPLSVALSASIARQRRTRLEDPRTLSPIAAVLAAIGAHHA